MTTINLAQPLNLFDIETLARDRLSASAHGYFASGANDEITLRANRAAYDGLYLRPRMLVDATRPDTDIVKALALGAAAVLVGRPVVWGLAVAG